MTDKMKMIANCYQEDGRISNRSLTFEGKTTNKVSHISDEARQNTREEEIVHVKPEEDEIKDQPFPAIIRVEERREEIGHH